MLVLAIDTALDLCAAAVLDTAAQAVLAQETLDMKRDPAGGPLKPLFSRAFEYSDGWVNDARLVALNARDAADRGARIRTRAKVVAARRDGDLWTVTVEGRGTRRREEVKARLLVNAAGPWVDHVLSEAIGRHDAHNVRLVQGSHIVIRKKFDDPRAFFFQNRDGRIIFAIPYQDDFTLIGTTDRDYDGDPAKVRATAEEIAYLCQSVNDYLATPVRPEDVVWAYAGVRPLYDDGASEAKEATRDYVFEFDTSSGAPILSIFGGKITTYRRLAEAALERLAPHLHGDKAQAGWTGKAPLPGGDLDVSAIPALAEELARKHPFVSRTLALRLASAYGTRAADVIGDAKSAADLGHLFGDTLTEREVRYLIAHEFARTAEDIVWRRSKLGLRLSAAEVGALDEWIATHDGGLDRPALEAGGRG